MPDNEYLQFLKKELHAADMLGMDIEEAKGEELIRAIALVELLKIKLQLSSEIYTLDGNL